MNYAAIVVLLSVLAAGPAYAAAALCSPDEEIVFSCQIKSSKKLVSVCKSKEFTNDVGYLQYRFGIPKRLELVYPKERTKTQEKFYMHAERLVGIHELTFQIGHHFYTVGHYTSAELSEVPEGTNKGMVIVATKGKKKNVGLECMGSPLGYLGKVVGAVRDIDELTDYP